MAKGSSGTGSQKPSDVMGGEADDGVPEEVQVSRNPQESSPSASNIACAGWHFTRII